ncbi:MAG: hypothetical protein WKF58_19935 [Ilumatobacteraceae bacterium]
MTPSAIRISPPATAEETAAIVAAVDALWPRAAAAGHPGSSAVGVEVLQPLVVTAAATAAPGPG